MILEQYILDNTKIKFHDDFLAKDITNQKELIDAVVLNLIDKINPPLSL